MTVCVAKALANMPNATDGINVGISALAIQMLLDVGLFFLKETQRICFVLLAGIAGMASYPITTFSKGYVLRSHVNNLRLHLSISGQIGIRICSNAES